MAVVQQKVNEFLDKWLHRVSQSGRKFACKKGVIFEYADGVWHAVRRDEEDNRLNPELASFAAEAGFNFIDREKREVWFALKNRLIKEGCPEFDTEPMLVFDNVTANMATGVIVENSPDNHATRRVLSVYDPEAECPEFLTMLDRIFEDHPEDEKAEIVQFLQEWYGVSLVRGPVVRRTRALKKALILVGQPGTAKSSLADLLAYVIGGKERHRIAAPHLHELSDRFGAECLIGSMALISDDGISTRRVFNANTFKVVVTGEPMEISRKYQPSVTYSFDGPVLFTANDAPNLADESSASYKRMVILKLDRMFTETDAKEHLEGHGSVLEFLIAKNEIPGIVNWMVEGYLRATERGRFIEPDISAKEAQTVRQDNDPIYDFLMSCCVENSDTMNPTAVLAIAARQFAEETHSVSISPSSAMSRLAKAIPSVLPKARKERISVEGGQVRCYSGIKLNPMGSAYFKVGRQRGGVIAETAGKECNFERQPRTRAEKVVEIHAKKGSDRPSDREHRSGSERGSRRR